MTTTVGETLTRITLSGAAGSADLVLPADEPVGGLVGDLAAAVGVTATDGYRLTTADGTVLDPSLSLRAAAVPDGAFVRLDAVVGRQEVATGRWGAGAQRGAATAVIVAAAAVAAGYAAPMAGAFGLIGAGVAGLLAGTVIALGVRAVGVAVAAGGSGAALVGCVLAPSVHRSGRRSRRPSSPSPSR